MNRVTNSAEKAIQILLDSLDKSQPVVEQAADLVQRVTAKVAADKKAADARAASKAAADKKAADSRAAAKAASDSAASAMDAYLAGK